MTENEAKEYLLNRYLVVGSPANPPKEECEKHNDVLDVAIYALEAIQAYRAIGTIDEFKEMKSGDFTEHLLNMGYTKGYNKAIDDVLEKALEWNKNSSKKVPYAFIHFIAEQLKGGVE